MGYSNWSESNLRNVGNIMCIFCISRDNFNIIQVLQSLSLWGAVSTCHQIVTFSWHLSSLSLKRSNIENWYCMRRRRKKGLIPNKDNTLQWDEKNYLEMALLLGLFISVFKGWSVSKQELYLQYASLLDK